MDFLKNAYGNYKKANSLKNWGIFAMALIALVVVVCVPILTIALGIGLLQSRYLDYRERIYELKTRRMMVVKGMQLMERETKQTKK